MKLAKSQATGCRRGVKRPSSRAGFTLAEVLAALVFMAIVIPVAVDGISVANRAGVVAGRKAVATRLAENMLNELLVTGEWESAGQRGTFEEGPEGYSWTLDNQAWDQGNMRQVSIEVTYPVRSQEYTVRLTTLVDGSKLQEQLQEQRAIKNDEAAAEAEQQ